MHEISKSSSGGNSYKISSQRWTLVTLTCISAARVCVLVHVHLFSNLKRNEKSSSPIMHVYDWLFLSFTLCRCRFGVSFFPAYLHRALNPASYSRSHHHTIYFNFLFNTKQRHIREREREREPNIYTIARAQLISLFVYCRIWLGMGDLIFIAITIIVITLFGSGTSATARANSTSHIRMTCLNIGQ